MKWSDVVKQRERLKSRLDRGMSLSEIAKEDGISVSAVSQRCARFDLASPGLGRKLPSDDVLKIILPVLSYSEAMRGFGVSRTPLQRASKRLNVSLRKKASSPMENDKVLEQLLELSISDAELDRVLGVLKESQK